MLRDAMDDMFEQFKFELIVILSLSVVALLLGVAVAAASAQSNPDLLPGKRVDLSAQAVAATPETQPAEPAAPSVPVTAAAAVAPATTWPATGMITTEFGVPHRPWQHTHSGIDIADERGRIGSPITPFREGIVTQVLHHRSGLGKHVIIDHGNGLTSSYGHLSSITTSAGALVKPGDVIGHMGSTGSSTGPHLHLEILENGVHVNPRNYLAGNPAPTY